MFVRHSDEKNLDDVKQLIKTSIKPSKLGVNIKRVVKTARGVLIETEGAAQLDKIRDCNKLKDNGLIFDKPRRRSPRLMIYDVDKDLINEIYEQNMCETGIDVENFTKEFKCVHRYKRKDPKDTRVTLVIECTARIHNILRSRDRLYIGWQSC